MTSFKQIEANRRNAQRSTGPTTEEGKRRSSSNAVRHGLTAETIIGTLEDVEDYKAFEESVAADYDAQSAVECELVLRLSNLLWRLRRATSVETGLFEIQAKHLDEVRRAREAQSASREVIYAMFGLTDSPNSNRNQTPLDGTNKAEAVTSLGPGTAELIDKSNADITRCFLRLANLPSYPLDRLSRYEATLWRQVGQVLCTLEHLDRCKPQERKRLASNGALHGQPNHED
jgi:hypothetical protein